MTTVVNEQERKLFISRIKYQDQCIPLKDEELKMMLKTETNKNQTYTESHKILFPKSRLYQLYLSLMHISSHHQFFSYISPMQSQQGNVLPRYSCHSKHFPIILNS
jgi:hypothetical protein